MGELVFCIEIREGGGCGEDSSWEGGLDERCSCIRIDSLVVEGETW
jgi:hypothetical protein